MKDLEELRARLRAFAKERDWGQFHSPKNLAMALSVEAAELLERFQWLTEQQSKELKAKDRVAVAEEMADVMIYLILLADYLGIDLLAESHKKVTKNGRRYPVALAKGRATKASHLRARRKARP
ncbi:MAG TPA: nucleotide pyrophosphohydrolase [Gammaproteobacteria bacterium]|nr:nucleotide pyrophosphohydrolase [Gammaproteobacteria bacterium]